MRALWVGVWLVTGCFRPAAQPGAPCSASGDCPNGQQCDTSAVPPTCVTALPDAPAPCSAGSCGAEAPICDEQTQACRGCIADAECGQGACTEYDGQCIPEPKVIFLSAEGIDAGRCDEAAPCRSFEFAFGQLTNQRRTIRLAPGAYSALGQTLISVTDTSGRIVISGEDRDPADTTLTSVPNANSPIVVLTNSNTDVVLEGAAVSGGPNSGVRSNGALLLSRVRIENNGNRGLETANNATVHVWDSTIADNNGFGVLAQNGTLEVLRSTIARNTDGGIITNRIALTIEGSFVVRNGNVNANQGGGLRLANLDGLPQKISFVTVAFNQAELAEPAGLEADGPVVVDNSIFVENGVFESFQICAGCSASFTMFSGFSIPFGQGNIGGPADFVDPATDNFHLLPTSKAREAADPGATGLVDVDGDARPIGDRCDQGADEIRL